MTALQYADESVSGSRLESTNSISPGWGFGGGGGLTHPQSKILAWYEMIHRAELLKINFKGCWRKQRLVHRKWCLRRSSERTALNHENAQEV
jgi:hypothetical protein